MAGTRLVQCALDNHWLAERRVPSLRQQWIEMHHGKQNDQFNPAAVNLTGTAWQVVWEAAANPPADPIRRRFHVLSVLFRPTKPPTQPSPTMIRKRTQLRNPSRPAKAKGTARLNKPASIPMNRP